MTILTILTVLAHCTFIAIRIVRLFRQPSKPDTQPTNKPRGKVSNSYRTDPKNRALQGDLLILLKGDVPTAKRLLAYQRRLNPGRSDNWYLEKVIYDLERDRH
ncbi:hypothetical protein [Nostoc sp.]|jgi:hypothetical protein|uniref:hypothetical protein n=1 Tax=Nostoc sp. TaxID=1180 RepID=UPI001F550275